MHMNRRHPHGAAQALLLALTLCGVTSACGAQVGGIGGIGGGGKLAGARAEVAKISPPQPFTTSKAVHEDFGDKLCVNYCIGAAVTYTATAPAKASKDLLSSLDEIVERAGYEPSEDPDIPGWYCQPGSEYGDDSKRLCSRDFRGVAEPSSRYYLRITVEEEEDPRLTTLAVSVEATE